MPATFRCQRRIEFRDTDAAGIAHFSAFFYFMEQAEHEFLRSLGLSVLAGDELGPISWPRVGAQCDFLGSVHFEDQLDIDVQLARVGEKSITYEFHMTHAGQPIAHGKLTNVCCRLDGGQIQSIPIPAWFRSRLEKWQAGESA